MLMCDEQCDKCGAIQTSHFVQRLGPPIVAELLPIINHYQRVAVCTGSRGWVGGGAMVAG